MNTPPAPKSLAPDDGLQRRWNWRPKVRWFAAEYLIVVLGVLTAVALNAWWEGRQDTATEAAYLHQIAADLDTTVALMENLDDELASSERAADRLFESFRAPEPLPADSILVWVSVASALSEAQPGLGTAEALVATGDLALIRDESLRTAIPAYLERQRSLLVWQAKILDLTVDAINAIIRQVDLVEADAAQVASGGLLVIPRPGVYGPSSVMTSPSPFPLNARRFQRDREAYTDAYRLGLAKIQARSVRHQMAEAAHDLRRRVEAELNR